MNEDSNQLEGNVSNYYSIAITGGEGAGVGEKLHLTLVVF